MNRIIEIEGLSRNFGPVQALKNVSLTVNEAEIFGVIGPDGSGKTTLFRIITTLLFPGEGRVSVMGLDAVKDYRELRKHIGYMPGRFSLYQDLSVEENLNFYATVFGTTVKENYDLIADIYSHIDPYRKRVAGKLSGGMKQKLALSCALIHKPKLLVLDEPTTGVDAVSRAEFWEMLAKLKHHNITILVSTPYMDEAMRCDRVALLQDGSVMSVDTPAMVKAGFSRKLYAVSSAQKYRLINLLRAHRLTLSAYPFGETIHATFIGDDPISEIKRYLESEGVADVRIYETEAGIEDRFLELMEQNKGQVTAGI